MCFVVAEALRDPYFLLCDVLKVTPGAEGVCDTRGDVPVCRVSAQPAWEGRDVPALTWHWLLPVTSSSSHNPLGWKSLQNH